MLSDQKHKNIRARLQASEKTPRGTPCVLKEVVHLCP